MKFTAALFAGLAAALPSSKHAAVSSGFQHSTNGTAPDPSSYENVDITEFSVREQISNSSTAVDSIASVYFVLNGNTTCSAENPGLEGAVFGCGETRYSFGLVNGTDTDFALRIYKATSQFAGLYGDGDVPTYCHAGGNNFEICSQVAETTIVIDNF